MKTETHTICLTTFVTYELKVTANNKEKALKIAKALLEFHGKEYFITNGQRREDDSQVFLSCDSELL